MSGEAWFTWMTLSSTPQVGISTKDMQYMVKEVQFLFDYFQHSFGVFLICVCCVWIRRSTHSGTITFKKWNYWVLATCKDGQWIASVHKWKIYSTIPLEEQATRTMTWYPTQSHDIDERNNNTSTSSILIMPSSVDFASAPNVDMLIRRVKNNTWFLCVPPIALVQISERENILTTSTVVKV